MSNLQHFVLFLTCFVRLQKYSLSYQDKLKKKLTLQN